jgi:hypothetical protein
MINKTTVILAMNQSMITNIGKNFRMICVDWDDTTFKIRVYSENEPEPEDYDLVSVILTEIEIHLNFFNFEMEIVSSKLAMNNLDPLKLIVFARHEGDI